MAESEHPTLSDASTGSEATASGGTVSGAEVFADVAWDMRAGIPVFGASPEPGALPGCPSLALGTLIGRYVVQSELGFAGVSITLAAYDPQLDRKLALKLLKYRREPYSTEQGAERAQLRLQREAEVLAKLDHPNVVAVYDVGVHEGCAFVAMEFVDGQPLTEWLRQPSRRPWREVLRVFLDAGAGLAAAHQAGLVHRDFKPSNVMIDRQGRARVMDFGLVLVGGPDSSESQVGADVDVEATAPGMVLGNPSYMPPEQFHSRPIDARSDQFSFCVALYEGLYGHRPFAGQGFPQLASAVLHGEIREPPRGTDVPTWLHRVVVRGLATNPEDRWPSMQALLDALRPVAMSFAARLIALSLRVLGVKRIVARQLANPPRSSSPFKPRRLPRKLEVEVRTIHARELVTMTRRGSSPRRHVLFFHGGAFVLEANPGHWAYARRLIDGAGCRVTMIDYPLAPEADATASFAMIAEAYDQLVAAYPDDELILAGDSAGASMSLSLAQLLVEREHPRPPVGCVLICPTVNLAIESPLAAEIEARDHLLSIRALRECCLPRWAGSLAHDHPYVAPMHGSLSGLPPTLVIYGTDDLLAADVDVFRARAEALGVDIRFHRYAGMQHDFVIMPIPEAKAATQQIIAFIAAAAKN